jgi:hypothetical protein
MGIGIGVGFERARWFELGRKRRASWIPGKTLDTRRFLVNIRYFGI